MSVEGPMASVSARFRAEGGAGFPGDDGAAGASAGALASPACGAVVAMAAAAAAAAGGGAGVVCAGVSAGAAAGAAGAASSVAISTGLVASASLLLCGRDAEPSWCGVVGGAVEAGSAGDAMVGGRAVLALFGAAGGVCRLWERTVKERVGWGGAQASLDVAARESEGEQ